MELTPRQRRAERRSRHENAVDMNLVSLIDVFTILIFFLLSSAGGVETLISPKSVKLPASESQTVPRESVVVTVSATDILVDGRLVASVSDVMRADAPVIASLKAELEQVAARQVVRQEKASQARRLTIMGDKDIPYSLLRKIMATGASANYADVSFAVRQRSAS
ncbi:biopolymer transporter ExbD [Aquabacterium sp.]|uniref:ExbD/TolR family protein n=1 Tax=Aquabacterium sp. TaxID=1872578 RepID=UPI002E2F3F32|nr:biopolymer transporter ExbD [Aquabacterium sp.]HEX5311817.1 biopolymer transporter ExbD [Aquabacterium sp.]